MSHMIHPASLKGGTHENPSIQIEYNSKKSMARKCIGAMVEPALSVIQTRAYQIRVLEVTACSIVPLPR